MKKRIMCAAGLISCFLVICGFQAFAGPAVSADGNWQGTLDVPGAKLRIVFRISKNEDGSLKSVLDSPDQGARGIPVEETVFIGDSLILNVKSIMGKFEGRLRQDGTGLDGIWKQGGMSFPLVMTKTESLPEVNRPQEPKRPFPYKEEEVSIRNEKANLQLAGTLTLPREGGPLPAVILISGSGPQDRDESLFGHKPFLVLSDFLTRKGIAVLRYDDRGTAKSTGDFSSATTEDFVQDALAAVQYLKSRKEIDPGKIGLAGHSEGAIIAPMAANGSVDVSFVVLLATPGMSGEKLLYLQAAAINRASGVDSKTIARDEAVQRRLFAVVLSQKDTAKAREQLYAVISDEAKKISDDEKKKSGFNEAGVKAQIRSLNTPWFRFFLAYDPCQNLSRLKCPVLALWGSKDLQVPPEKNVPPVEQALKKSGNRNAAVKVLPGLNHLFQSAQTGAPSEYGKIDETFSTTALSAVGGWIAAQTAK
jgi:uncharacterized protein